jgi:hypothetical protein
LAHAPQLTGQDAEAAEANQELADEFQPAARAAMEDPALEFTVLCSSTVRLRNGSR